MLEVEDDISRFGKRSSRSGGSLGERSLAVVAFGSVTMIGSHRSGRCAGGKGPKTLYSCTLQRYTLETMHRLYNIHNTPHATEYQSLF